MYIIVDFFFMFTYNQMYLPDEEDKNHFTRVLH